MSAASLIVGIALATGGVATANDSSHGGGVTSSSLGAYAPTFVGPAGTGCASGCDLLTGPLSSPSTALLSPTTTSGSTQPTGTTQTVAAGVIAAAHYHTTPSPLNDHAAPDPAPPSVNCGNFGSGCDAVSTSSGGAVGVKGLNAVDSGTLSTNVGGDIEPADQGLCAGNGYVVEDNNIGEVLVLNTALHRESGAISMDTMLGLTSINWSSGGDISCLYDQSNGGHFFFTEFVSASSEADGGTFAGCFAGVANTCYEAIAVTTGSSPFGPYNVYFVNANYNPSEPGAPYLLNDFAKISATRDAFLLFYDEFPLVTPGVGGGGFNGAQEFAFNKTALEEGLPVFKHNGQPNPEFTVAIENMGNLPTPNGTCASDNLNNQPATSCWYSVIPTIPADSSQWDNSHGGSAFMMDTLDYYGLGDNRLAVFDWTGLGNLNSDNCASCSGIHFGGQLFSGVQTYYDEAFVAPQKVGPIPLGDQCGAAGLSTDTSCPEGGIETNGDNVTQAAQSQGQLWTAVSTAITQSFHGGAAENHIGAAYFVVGTSSFDSSGKFSLTGEGYIAAAHEDLEFPAMAVTPTSGFGNGPGGAIVAFTLSGNGGPGGADHGGYYPSTAYGRVSANSNGLQGSTINVVDLGQSPEDGFAEYLGYPGPTDPRWGDYSNAVYMPGTGRVYFATNYIQYRNCSDSALLASDFATCGGTRDIYANWGTSVNYVTP
ncbi:MAG: hypothetical protein ACRDV0_00040 [Acidimicrobiales bacterium]